MDEARDASDEVVERADSRACAMAAPRLAFSFLTIDASTRPEGPYVSASAGLGTWAG